jgi:predicted NodU family carbamoyl transferase
VANARILRESGFERPVRAAAPGDAGCALGAALYADRIHFGNPTADIPTTRSGAADRGRRAGAIAARTGCRSRRLATRD